LELTSKAAHKATLKSAVRCFNLIAVACWRGASEPEFQREPLPLISGSELVALDLPLRQNRPAEVRHHIKRGHHV
jgi:hypothetical protein